MSSIFARQRCCKDVYRTLICLLVLFTYSPIGVIGKHIPSIEQDSVIEMAQQRPNLELEPICGLHPIDILISGLLGNMQSTDSVNILSNSLTSLYRTQPKFYAFVMQCTSAWNQCQRAQASGRDLSEETDHSWKVACLSGLGFRRLFL